MVFIPAHKTCGVHVRTKTVLCCTFSTRRMLLTLEVGYRGHFWGHHLGFLSRHLRKLLLGPNNTKITFFSKFRQKPMSAAIFRPKSPKIPKNRPQYCISRTIGRRKSVDPSTDFLRPMVLEIQYFGRLLGQIREFWPKSGGGPWFLTKFWKKCYFRLIWMPK